MLFLDDTTPLILTESGDTISTEQETALYGDNVSDLVQITIPIMKVDSRRDLTLITISDTTGERFEYPSRSVEVKVYKVTATFNFNIDMPNGQYHFILSDADGELQKGLMQVGMRSADVKQYESEIKIMSYERR